LEVFTIVEGMSALPPKADIRQRNCDVRFVPKADISRFTRSPRQRGEGLGQSAPTPLRGSGCEAILVSFSA